MHRFWFHKWSVNKGANTSISYSIIDLSATKQRHQPGKNGLQFAVFFTNQYEQIVYDETYFRLELKQGKYTRNGTLIPSEIPLELGGCDNSTFNFEKFGFTDYNDSHIFCPVNDDYIISGNFASEAYEYLQINLLECNPNDENLTITCKSPEEIRAYVTNGRFNMVLVNSYIDFDDYDTPIKTFLDDRYTYKIVYDYQKIAKLYVRQNDAILADDLIQYGQTEKKEYYSIENDFVDFQERSETTRCKVVLTEDYFKYTYERTVFSILDLTGLLGGVFELFEILGAIFVSYFTQRFLTFSLLSRLYQVQYNENGETISKIIPRTTSIESNKINKSEKPMPKEEKKIPQPTSHKEPKSVQQQTKL